LKLSLSIAEAPDRKSAEFGGEKARGDNRQQNASPLARASRAV
jgi:hypothetical protein